MAAFDGGKGGKGNKKALGAVVSCVLLAGLLEFAFIGGGSGTLPSQGGGAAIDSGDGSGTLGEEGGSAAQREGACDAAGAGEATSAVGESAMEPSDGGAQGGGTDTGEAGDGASAAATGEGASAPGEREAADVPRLPQVGMDASLIDETELGPHDGESRPIDGGMWKGGASYYWLARNGTGDQVFSAIVKDGEVVKVNKFNMFKDYWNDGTVTGRDFPDLYASGEEVPRTTVAPQLDDPVDYATPEEYADNNEGYFEYYGYDDPWDAAFQYWEGNAA